MNKAQRDELRRFAEERLAHRPFPSRGTTVPTKQLLWLLDALDAAEDQIRQWEVNYKVILESGREADKRVAELEGKLGAAQEIAAQQAEDDALWAQCVYMSEAYMQQELRRLTEAVEGKTSVECAKTVLD